MKKTCILRPKVWRRRCVNVSIFYLKEIKCFCQQYCKKNAMHFPVVQENHFVFRYNCKQLYMIRQYCKAQLWIFLLFKRIILFSGIIASDYTWLKGSFLRVKDQFIFLFFLTWAFYFPTWERKYKKLVTSTAFYFKPLYTSWEFWRFYSSHTYSRYELLLLVFNIQWRTLSLQSEHSFLGSFLLFSLIQFTLNFNV